MYNFLIIIIILIVIKPVRPTLKIGHLSTAYHTNFLLMNDKKLEKKSKIKFQWRMFGTGPLMMDAFKKRELDIGYLGLPPAIIGIDNSVPIKCVAGGHIEGTLLISHTKYNSLNIPNEFSDILEQFQNTTIGVPSKGSIHDVILNKYLTKFDLINTISIKNYRSPELIALDLKDGKIEAGVGTPSLAIFSSTLMNSKIIIPPRFFWPYNPSYGVFALEELIVRNPEVIELFLMYHKKASTLLRMNPKKAASKISKNIKVITKDYVEAVLKISPRYCISLSKDYIDTTMEFMKILGELDYIKRNYDVREIFYKKLVENIHPEKEHY
ncbi:MAG: ABC transporter substrate-binding protein [Candidatus Lokiarchaeota archaeon]|nr:ABC transporter substrate-binding protein [Candidatus Lokiarchaeota archaeon]MBD3198426.1 ABC transporter substrate-binding protein [Candidatus Lokiarchaeota archaeon]